MRHALKILTIDLWLLGCGVGLLQAAPAGGAAKPGLEKAKKTLHELQGRLRLARSVDEFVEGIDFFDEHLYGRVKSGPADPTRVTQLENTIKTKNSQLETMMNNPPESIKDGQNSMVTSDTRDYYNTVYNLENDIAGMLAELKTLQSGSGMNTPSELLDGSLWREKAGPGLLDPNGEDLGKAVERYRRLVRELQKETAPSAGSPAGPTSPKASHENHGVTDVRIH